MEQGLRSNAVCVNFGTSYRGSQTPKSQLNSSERQKLSQWVSGLDIKSRDDLHALISAEMFVKH